MFEKAGKSPSKQDGMAFWDDLKKGLILRESQILYKMTWHFQDVNIANLLGASLLASNIDIKVVVTTTLMKHVSQVISADHTLSSQHSADIHLVQASKLVPQDSSTEVIHPYKE